MGPDDPIFSRSAPETRANLNDPTVPLSSANFMAFFGLDASNLPAVTIDKALMVPAVLCAVNFLAGALASLPRHLYRTENDTAVRAGGPLQRIINEAPNSEWSAFGMWKYFWQQVFTGGR